VRGVDARRATISTTERFPELRVRAEELVAAVAARVVVATTQIALPLPKQLPRGTHRKDTIMARSIRDAMTKTPASLSATSTVADAAHQMRELDIGDVLIEEGGRLVGIVTDRDLVVRALAEGRDATSTLGDIVSAEVVCITPSDSPEDAIRLMRERALRRVPVVENGRPVGILSLGDLAAERDPDSVLGEISTAPPNH
jgi:CBS domain-containing protein